FSLKVFGFQVFTTDKEIRPTSAECGMLILTIPAPTVSNKKLYCRQVNYLEFRNVRSTFW
ncbi:MULTISPECIES: hypothetical protein, partial [unclassified Microcoleus]|uniref:hypothetical protein n=1 Tax=unclassified Microcoleus TaxID=2642155 RepID=UPI002FD1FA41